MRYRTGNSIKDRKNRPCDGYRNWDTAATCVVLRNDKRCFDYIQNNAGKLLSMKKEDKLRVLERKSSYGFGGVSYRNVDYKELNATLSQISKKKPVYDYSEDLSFDERGRVKGHYVNGRFEPD